MTDQPTPHPGAPRPPRPPQLPKEDLEPLEGGADLPNLLNKLLRKPLSLVHAVETDPAARNIPVRLLFIASICLAVFGLVVGTFSWNQQIWAAPLKIIGGLLFSALICLPSLYIFACLGGLDARFRTVVGLLAGLVALSALLLVGFAPVVWLFSVSSSSVTFLGFLLLVLWMVCAGFGMTLLLRAGRALGMPRTGHLVVWSGVFLLVTLQMTTTLRPIIGTSDKFLDFGEKKFFLGYWSEQLTATTPSLQEASDPQARLAPEERR